MAFAGCPVIISYDEASHIWKAPQQGTMHQGYEHMGIHAPELTPPPDLNAEFGSMMKERRSESSPFHSLTTTPDAVTDLGQLANLQGSALSWIPTEGTAPSLDSYGNVYNDGTGGAYVSAEKDVESQWNTYLPNAFLLDVGIPPGPSHDDFQ